MGIREHSAQSGGLSPVAMWWAMLVWLRDRCVTMDAFIFLPTAQPSPPWHSGKVRVFLLRLLPLCRDVFGTFPWSWVMSFFLDIAILVNVCNPRVSVWTNRQFCQFFYSKRRVPSPLRFIILA